MPQGPQGVAVGVNVIHIAVLLCLWQWSWLISSEMRASSFNPALFSMCLRGNDQKALDGGGQVTFSNPLSPASARSLRVSASDPLSARGQRSQEKQWSAGLIIDINELSVTF